MNLISLPNHKNLSPQNKPPLLYLIYNNALRTLNIHIHIGHDDIRDISNYFYTFGGSYWKKGGHFAKLKLFSIAKITSLWRGQKFKTGHGPLISAAYVSLCASPKLNFTVCIYVAHRINDKSAKSSKFGILKVSHSTVSLTSTWRLNIV